MKVPDAHHTMMSETKILNFVFEMTSFVQLLVQISFIDTEHLTHSSHAAPTSVLPAKCSQALAIVKSFVHARKLLCGLHQPQLVATHLDWLPSFVVWMSGQERTLRLLRIFKN